MAGQKVLVAEDNADSRELVCDILVSLGYEPLRAENGRIALDIVFSDNPDLVILDINMPEVDGFEVCATIKRHPLTAQIPVILLTAQSDVDSRVIGLGLGADDYLPKPFHPKELIARINTRLRAAEINDTLRFQREQIRQTFARFVAPEIVEKLLQDPTRIRLGGEQTELTVMFADLESFTTVSERADPEQLLEVLNAYHTLLVHYIEANGGTVDKFLGDGVMALYNTPLPLPDHALHAVCSALHIRDALREFHQSLDPMFRLGINAGIHTGLAIVGNVGTPDRMDFTAIGDTVNLASRLQGLSSHNQITISEETYRLVADEVECERTGPRVVRGREEPVITYLALRLR